MKPYHGVQLPTHCPVSWIVKNAARTTRRSPGLYSMALTRRSVVNPRSTTVRLTSFGCLGAIVIGSSARDSVGSPSGQAVKSADARTACGFGVLESDVFVKTAPPFLGPSPSIHDTMNCDSRSVMVFAFANRPYPEKAGHGGMWRASTAALIFRFCSHTSS